MKVHKLLKVLVGFMSLSDFEKALEAEIKIYYPRTDKVLFKDAARWSRDFTLKEQAELVEALERIIPYAESGVPKPSHVGSCTPETSCDMDCSHAFYAANVIYTALAALTKFREGKKNE